MVNSLWAVYITIYIYTTIYITVIEDNGSMEDLFKSLSCLENIIKNNVLNKQ